MTQSEALESARRRARAKFVFMVHAILYGIVMILLMMIDFLAAPGVVWFVWPALGWGLPLALHGVWAFVIAERTMIIDALTKRELQQQTRDDR